MDILAGSDPEVIVVGAGLTGITAAIAAREAGADVLVLEKGVESDLGGNASFSGGLFLFCYDDADDLTSITEERIDALRASRIEAPPFTVDAYVAELDEMSEGRADPALSRMLAERSLETMRWLAGCGVRFEFGPFGAYVRDDTLYVPPGQALQVAGHGWHRGINMIRALAEHAQKLGVRFRYAAPVSELVVEGGRVAGVIVRANGDRDDLRARCVVVASGGYQASRELRRKHLGEAWSDVRLRGTRHSDGSGILAGLAAGAASAGDWSRCHSAAVDPGYPSPVRNDQPSPPPLHGFWLGILVNRLGKRFVDEGPGPWIRNYSKMGKAIMGQPGGEAFQLFDQKTAARVAEVFAPTADPITGQTLNELASKLDLPADALEATVEEFGRSTSPEPFDPDVLDGKHTIGLDPPKSNWAAPLDRPPFVAYRAVTGLTFTFAGLRIDPDGHALDERGDRVPGLYAAGEASGGLFFGDYPGGAALMRAAVFGRVAGASAAAEAHG